MAPAQPAPFPRIVRNPRVHGGEPVVRGTRVPVRAVVVAWQEYGEVEILLEAYPRLTVEDIEQVLSYYEAHREEIDRQIDTQLAGARTRKGASPQRQAAPLRPHASDAAIASELVLGRDWNRPEEDAAWADL